MVERRGAVTLLRINRAAKMNSLDFGAANDALVAAWHDFAADDSARVAVITARR